MLIESIVGKFIGEILAFIMIGFITFVTGAIWRYRNELKTTKQRQNRLENNLYGFEKDESDDGFIPRTDDRLDQQEEDIKDIKEDVTYIKSTLQHINDKLDD